MKTLTFTVKRFAPNTTTLEDVDRFILEHQGEKHDLLVEIDPTGIGDAFADRLENAGFAVITCGRGR